MIHLTSLGLNPASQMACTSISVQPQFAGIDQQQTVAGVDQVDAHPAVAHIPHIAPDAEGMDVAVQRVQPDGAEVGLGQRLAAGSVIFVFLFDGHGSFSFTDCITV